MLHLISPILKEMKLYVGIRVVMQLLIIATAFSLHEVLAGDLRGRVNATNSFAQYSYPLTNAPVIISRFNEGQGKWIPVSQVYTNSSGEYFFRSMQPGRYQIEIYNQRYTFVVTGEKFQDIAPILIRR